MNNEVLFSESLRLRIIELEYKNLDEENFIKEVKRIYLEETGESLELEINYLSSNDAKRLEGDKSGYDGTAIHFYSEKQNIDQIYIISQGSTDRTDWNYNVGSIFAGTRATQSQSIYRFKEEALENFKTDSKSQSTTTIIGLSHSLGHNNNIIAQLSEDVFDKLYGVNGAQPTIYQLFETDINFREALIKRFKINRSDPDSIYGLPPDELKAFGEDYYKDKAQNIHQTLSVDDLLFALAGTRGFVMLGNVEMVDTNPELSGLRDMMDKVPDEIIADFQQLAIQYADASEKGDSDEVIKELTGIDMKLVDKYRDGGVLGFNFVFASNMKETENMIQDVKTKLPELLRLVRHISDNGEIIVNELAANGYISESEKTTLLNEIESVRSNLETILSNEFSVTKIGDIISAASSLSNSPDVFKKILGPLLKEIVHSHSIEEMLNTLGKENGRMYLGNDMIAVGQQDGQEVHVNISEAIRMYQEGQALLEEKRGAIFVIMRTYQNGLVEAFDTEKTKVVTIINDIEHNPQAYSASIFRKYVYSARGQKTVTKIEVHDSLTPLTGISFDPIWEQLTTAIQRTEDFLTSTREAIEQIFQKDEIIASLFNYHFAEGVEESGHRGVY
ncbi:hypothetical protein P6709_15375 [Jeotgalibacillus sp. ET6]|uniref:DUF6792 domain-containing protein n=1 Tax=Jeotgalibacillus sp. ET6 TaxID=3037260 RepID=UPI0024188964|nr:DUF6792 domain-containing protein [Jeotgalibacillus sp. ET6]MDG5473133.1 hypothetical protein [Jeotgalibacillus sp. ET6]